MPAANSTNILWFDYKAYFCQREVTVSNSRALQSMLKTTSSFLSGISANIGASCFSFSGWCEVWPLRHRNTLISGIHDKMFLFQKVSPNSASAGDEKQLAVCRSCRYRGVHTWRHHDRQHVFLTGSAIILMLIDFQSTTWSYIIRADQRNRQTLLTCWRWGWGTGRPETIHPIHPSLK